MVWVITVVGLVSACMNPLTGVPTMLRSTDSVRLWAGNEVSMLMRAVGHRPLFMVMTCGPSPLPVPVKLCIRCFVVFGLLREKVHSTGFASELPMYLNLAFLIVCEIRAPPVM